MAGYASHFSRLIPGDGLAGSAQPGRWNIGCIGFQHQRLQGQLLCQSPDLQCPCKRHGAAKTQRKSQLDKLPGLLNAAIERMGYETGRESWREGVCEFG